MSIFEALVLGLVQGLTEFIPVSSSGHLLLGHELFGSSDSTLGFDVALHVGTLIALVVFFRKDIITLLTNLFAKNEHGRLARLLIISTIPAMVAGLLLSDFIDENLRSPAIVAFSLSIVAVMMLVVDRLVKNKSDKEITQKQGMSVGLAQALALVPGVSRSGATITAGVFVGLSREQATRFSFLLAMPIVAGSALGVLLKGDLGGESTTPLLVGMLAAFLSGTFAIRFMLKSISKVGLKPFAYYRIALALIVLLFVV